MKTGESAAFRWGLLAVGSFVAASGISMIAQSQLGTTPISSIPYTVSRLTPLSFGEASFLFNVLLVFLQWAVLGKAFRMFAFLQIPAVFVFSACIDFSMTVLSFLSTASYPVQLFASFFGNLVLASGIVLQIRSRTIVQPGEGFVLALTVRFKKAFGTLKIWNDATLVLLAALIGIAFSGGVIGIREGTLLSAFATGMFVKLIMRIWPQKPDS